MRAPGAASLNSAPPAAPALARDPPTTPPLSLGKDTVIQARGVPSPALTQPSFPGTWALSTPSTWLWKGPELRRGEERGGAGAESDRKEGLRWKPGKAGLRAGRETRLHQCGGEGGRGLRGCCCRRGEERKAGMENSAGLADPGARSVLESGRAVGGAKGRPCPEEESRVGGGAGEAGGGGAKREERLKRDRWRRARKPTRGGSPKVATLGRSRKEA